jgi:hypothetical protein
MDVRPELSELAARYHCDPKTLRDPVLDVVLDLRKDLLSRLGGSDAGQIHSEWERIGEDLDARTARLKTAVEEYGAETARAEALAKKTAQGLLASRQIGFRARATAFLVGVLSAGGAAGVGFAWMQSRSADTLLAQAHVRLTVEPSREGHRVTLQGAQVLRSGQAADKIVVEFSR